MPFAHHITPYDDLTLGACSSNNKSLPPLPHSPLPPDYGAPSIYSTVSTDKDKGIVTSNFTTFLGVSS